MFRTWLMIGTCTIFPTNVNFWLPIFFDNCSISKILDQTLAKIPMCLLLQHDICNVFFWSCQIFIVVCWIETQFNMNEALTFKGFYSQGVSLESHIWCNKMNSPKTTRIQAQNTKMSNHDSCFSCVCNLIYNI
jgi:hypothetical protein